MSFENVYIHPTAEVSPQAVIGNGSKIWNLAQVRERAVLGNDCIVSKNVYIDSDVIIGSRVKIQNNVNVYHGVTIEDDVFLGPSMTFTNDLYPRAFVSDFQVYPTLVQKGASIGAHAVIVCGITVGEYAMIGSGSVVTKDIPAHALFVGNPARQIGYVCHCGQKLTGDLACPTCNNQYHLNNDGIHLKK